MELGVYIHYPWCRRRCDYCDFAIAVAPLPEIPQVRYRSAVLEELDHRATQFAGRRLVSIYIGGGTPSLWPPEQLAGVIAEVAGRFDAALPELEVTIEANPIDCGPANLEGWAAAGINRLSIGVQSIDASELAVLGRDHSMGDGLAAIDAAAGVFAKLSGDVILGAPGASKLHGLDAVSAIADRGVDHLSVYELTIEERAPLGRSVERGEVIPVAADDLAELYVRARELLEGRGYEHYEISSFARPGHRARHNSLYWAGGEYLGLGASASSFRRIDAGGIRSSNHRSVGRYLGAPVGAREAERRELDSAEYARDRVWLGMRTSAGVDVDQFKQFADGVDIEQWLLGEGLAERSDDRIRPTLRGFLFADRVAARVLG